MRYVNGESHLNDVTVENWNSLKVGIPTIVKCVKVLAFKIFMLDVMLRPTAMHHCRLKTIK